MSDEPTKLTLTADQQFQLRQHSLAMAINAHVEGEALMVTAGKFLYFLINGLPIVPEGKAPVGLANAKPTKPAGTSAQAKAGASNAPASTAAPQTAAKAAPGGATTASAIAPPTTLAAAGEVPGAPPLCHCWRTPTRSRR
jgi:hypothetical protein